MGLATVKTDIAPLYERADRLSARVDEALYGMSVQIMQESENGWCYLRTEYGTEGYTPAAFLETDVDVATAWRKYKKITVLAPYVDIQQKASNEGGCLVSVPRGGILVPLGGPGADGWQKIGLTDGAVGYTRSSYLGELITDWSLLSEEDFRWNIVETALSYNGAAFRSGGRTPMGIDAVGLAAMTYMMNGVVIAQQPFIKPGLALHSISFEKMKEGDLLYFGEGMGVYIGDNRFVHATDKQGEEGVLVNSLRPKDNDYRGDLAGHITSVGSVF